MCNSEMDLGLEASKYKNPRFDIVSRIAYLLGVSEEYFLGEESNFDEKIYTELEECKDGRIVRNLCIIRTALLRNNGRIRNLFQYDMKNIDTIPEYIAPECIKKLKKDEVDIWRANWTPAKYVVLVSAEIKKHINGCKNSFPLWLNWDYVKDMFCLPELKERQVSKLVESYGEKRNRFPYTMYVVGALSVEVGNILYNDEKFVSYLYRRNGDMFDDLSKVTDASDEIKKNIKDYIRDNQEITIVVDCENANPYKLYSVLDGLEPTTREHIKKIGNTMTYSISVTNLGEIEIKLEAYLPANTELSYKGTTIKLGSKIYQRLIIKIKPDYLPTPSGNGLKTQITVPLYKKNPETNDNVENNIIMTSIMIATAVTLVASLPIAYGIIKAGPVIGTAATFIINLITQFYSKVFS